ncbi:MAG TPA: carbon storage regulator CsrA [Pirellulales bacterium]|jgi:carbon storage regulator
MLVLSRKLGEKIVIGSNIVLEIVDVRAGRVRLAFDAPREVTIHREEVLHQIHCEEKKAGNSATTAPCISESGMSLAPPKT